MTTSDDIVIAGGGAAGLMAACSAASAGRRVVVLERLSAPGRKLLACGGGRCNLTTTAPTEAILCAFGRQGAFMRQALQGFGPDALRAFLAAEGVPSVAQPDGCVFPVSQRAADVLAALLGLASRHGAQLRGGVRVTAIHVTQGAVSGVATSAGDLPCRRLLVALGGCAYPALGSDGSGLQLAAATGHEVVAPLPALVPLRVAEPWARQFPGLVLQTARVSLAGVKGGQEGPLLFTHQGLSGPPALNLSGEVAARLAAAPAGGGVTLLIALRADRDAAAWQGLFEAWRQAQGGRAVHNLLAGELPRALAQALCGQAGLNPGHALAQTPRVALVRLASLCAALPLTVTATEAWSQAMVTRGGVALREIDPLTLESRRVRGLHFAGEMVDLDGPCGGYNLTWAFASGWLAGRQLAAAALKR